MGIKELFRKRLAEEPKGFLRELEEDRRAVAFINLHMAANNESIDEGVAKRLCEESKDGRIGPEEFNVLYEVALKFRPVSADIPDAVVQSIWDSREDAPCREALSNWRKKIRSRRKE